MAARSPVAFGLLKIFAKAGTCEVSRPIMPARSGAGSAAREAAQKFKESVESMAQHHRFNAVPGVGLFISLITVEEPRHCGDGSALLAERVLRCRLHRSGWSAQSTNKISRGGF